MTAGAADLLGFMISYLYGFILLVFPMVFCILRANGLVAKYVDRGSMACLLAARASCVVEMFCGLPTVLKGELPEC